MMNGIGVVGWRVGASRPRPHARQRCISLTPDVVGVNLKGKLHPACDRDGSRSILSPKCCARRRFVGKLVEFFSAKAAPRYRSPIRATIPTWRPSKAPLGFSPIDDKTIAYFKGTGLPDAEISAFEGYYKAKQMYGVPKRARS